MSRRSSPVFVAVPCPICRGTNFSVMRPGNFPADLSEQFLREVYRSSSDQTLFEQVVICKECHVVYLNPRLKGDLIIDAYAQGEDESFIAQDAMRFRTFTKALRSLAHRYNLPLTAKTKVLDIGCAGGAFVRAAEELGMSAIGIEPNQWLSAYAQTTYGLDVRPGVLADYTFRANTFDLITLWDVIEHVPDPGHELSQINRILKPQGLLVINYPDYQSLPAKLLGRKWPFWLSVHLTYYTPATIRKHLAACGFEAESIKPHWQTLELGYILKRMTPYMPPAQWIKKVTDTTRLSLLPFTYWIGQTSVVAKKVRSL